MSGWMKKMAALHSNATNPTCHPREGGGPVLKPFWIPAYAGMTSCEKYIHHKQT